MTLVIDHGKTGKDSVTFAVDRDDHMVAVSRQVLRMCIRKIETSDVETQKIAGWDLGWDDLTTLWRATEAKRQEEFDIRQEKLKDRARQFDSNWE